VEDGIAGILSRGRCKQVVRRDAGRRLMAEATAAAAPLIDRPVAGDAEQPGDETTSRRIEEVRPAPETEEYLLGNVFGELGIADDAERDGIDIVAVAIEERFERFSVAIGKGENETGIARRGVFEWAICFFFLLGRRSTKVYAPGSRKDS
jgi:hypothetical protein